jgi:hypothetical protein
VVGLIGGVVTNFVVKKAIKKFKDLTLEKSRSLAAYQRNVLISIVIARLDKNVGLTNLIKTQIYCLLG